MTEQLEPGAIFRNQYKLKKEVGQHSAYQSWLATDESTGNEVLVKALRSEISSRRIKASRERLKEMQGLIHPNILLAIDLDSQGNLPYIIEPVITDARPATKEDISWKLIDPLIDAIAFSNSVGIAHGYIHPGNLLIDRESKIHISGFGLPSDFNLNNNYNDFLQKQSSRKKYPVKEEDIFSIGRFLAYSLSGSVDFDLKNYSLPMSSETREILSIFLNESSNYQDIDLYEAKIILAEHFDNQKKTIDAISFRRNSEEPENRVLQESSSRKNYNLRLSRNVLLSGLVFFLVSSVAIFYLLPIRLSPVSLPELDTESSYTPTQTRKLLTPKELAEMEMAGERAKKLAKEILEKQLSLEELRVNLWASLEFASAQDIFNTAENFFLQGNVKEAITNYTKANNQLGMLEKKASTILSDKIEAGIIAIENEDFNTAIEALSIATAIDQDNSELKRLFDKARNLEDVISLVKSASLNEEDSNLEKARDLYAQAIKLDGDWEKAKLGLNRTESKIKEERYMNSMSKGSAALSKKNYVLAKKNFEAARSLFPKRDAPQDGLLQVEQDELNTIVNRHIITAEKKAGDFEWAAAQSEYEAALALTPGLKIAKENLKKVEERLSLNLDLKRLTQDPTLLKSDQELSRAITLIANLSNKERISANTNQQIEELANYISLARTEIPILFLSDNKSEVIIEKTKRLGKFQEQEIRLIPGRYTLTASRPEYRDVRTEIIILPWSPERDFYIVNTELIR